MAHFDTNRLRKTLLTFMSGHEDQTLFSALSRVEPDGRIYLDPGRCRGGPPLRVRHHA